MGKPRYVPPTDTFPYKISRRLDVLSVPRKYITESVEETPAYTPLGVRKSALNGVPTDRIADAAWPPLRKLLMIKKMYRNRFSLERLERIDRMIEAANATFYTKLANCGIDLKKMDAKDLKKKRGWTESDWKKHMEYIGQIAGPKNDFMPPPVHRGERKALDELLPRINRICLVPDFKMYRRLSQEVWYRDPIKVPPNALKYQITDRVKKLATPRALPQSY